MRRRPYSAFTVKRAVVSALVGALLLVGFSDLIACKRHRNRVQSTDGLLSVRSSKDASPTERLHQVLGPGDTVQDVSIYDLKTPIVDHEGAALHLDVFRGHPVLISMFYTSCPYACPTLISNIKRIENALDATTRNQVRILLISFDPERDTPAVLRTTIEKAHLDASRWRLAVATEEGAREIGAVLGIKYRELDGSFNHSSVITLLDRHGKIDQRLDGMGDTTQVAVQRLRRLSAQR